MVVNIAAALSLERPCVALVERGSVGIGEGAGLDFVDSGIPLLFRINAVPIVSVAHLVVSGAYLSARNLDMGIAQYLSVFRASVDGGCNERCAADFQIRGVRHSKFVGDSVAAVETFAGTEHITKIIIGSLIRGVWHQRMVNAHLSAADQHLGQTGIRRTGLGLAFCMEVALAGCVICREGAHRAQLAAAVDTAAHMTFHHVYQRVACHHSRCGVSL